jgi:type IV secretory pathway TraG/TraD family ATPase VirD4
LQAQSQLKNMYKDNAETIIGNMDARLFLGGSEKTTLKDLSESLGKETIDLLNHSESKGSSPSFSRSYQKLGKELMSIDEVGGTRRLEVHTPTARRSSVFIRQIRHHKAQELQVFIGLR